MYMLTNVKHMYTRPGKYCMNPYFHNFQGINRQRNDPKYSINLKIRTDRSCANTVDPDKLTEPSDQGLYCLPFHVHILDALLYVKTTVFKF